MHKVSFTNILFQRIALFVLLPVVIVVMYSLTMSYRSQASVVDSVISSQNIALSATINSKLTQLQYATMELSRHKDFAELTEKSVSSKIVDASMQQFVQQSSLVHSAFIIDQQALFIAGFPLTTQQFETTKLETLLSKKVAHPELNKQPELHYLNTTIFKNLDVGQESEPSYLAFVSTLQNAKQSLSNPQRNALFLFVLLDQAQLLTVADPHLQKLQVPVEKVLGSAKHDFTTHNLSKVNYYKTQQELALNVWQNNQQSPLNLFAYYNKSPYFTAIYQNIFFSLVGLLGIFILAFVTLRWCLKKLNTPIQEMVQISQQITHGDFHIPTEINQFTELHPMHDALRLMAIKINEQIQHLQDARDIAEKSDKLKSQFLATMSHEIRTPLNGVLGILQLLQNKVTDDKQNNMLSTALQSSQNLLRILNDILDFSKIEANQLDIENVAFNPQAVIAEACALLDNSCQQKDLKLHINIAPELEQNWSGDSLRLSQILQNLLSNAVKFSSQGSITLSAYYHCQEQQHFLRFSITDEGIGISQEQLALLFTPFKQPDTHTTRQFGSTGLGLTISQRLVSLMNGELSVTSELGHGSCFSFSIKVDKVTSQTSEVLIEAQEQIPDLSNKRILVAEDNLINQEIIKLMLETTKAQICLAENGRQVIQQVTAFQPDLILMDVQMPEMDGVSATKVLRELQLKIPIIMLTANISGDDIESYLIAGANDVLAKPTDLSQLYLKLSHYLA
jgi:signal transduction histidine kinase